MMAKRWAEEERWRGENSEVKEMLVKRILLLSRSRGKRRCNEPLSVRKSTVNDHIMVESDKDA